MGTVGPCFLDMVSITLFGLARHRPRRKLRLKNLLIDMDFAPPASPSLVPLCLTYPWPQNMSSLSLGQNLVLTVDSPNICTFTIQVCCTDCTWNR